jgi:hypothetical protein
MLRQKQLQEAKKELEELAKNNSDIRDERFLILKAYITFM